MTDAVTSSPQATLRLPEEKRKSARKSQPAQFPNRLTICIADDQLATLQQIKAAYRSSESFVVRMAFDVFARTNGFTPLNNGGANVGR
jgi:hypothetical protein